MQIVESLEYESPEDAEDEEIDEDEAFNSEDEKTYAGWFGQSKQGDEGQENDEGEEGEYNTDDFSEEEEVGGTCTIWLLLLLALSRGHLNRMSGSVPSQPLKWKSCMHLLA